MRRQISGDHSDRLERDGYLGHVLRDLLSGRDPLPLLAELGWQHEGPSVVLVASLDAPGERRWVEQGRFARSWQAACRDHGSGLPCADLGTEVVAVLPVTATPGARRAGEDLVHRVVATVAGDLQGASGFTCGVSRAAPDGTGLATAYDQARRAAEIGRERHGGGATTFFDDLGLDRLLAAVPDPRVLREVARDVLGPLAADDPEAEGLRETLQVLLDCNFNVAEAARAQFFHYNTMRYRLAKIERLVGPVSSDARVRLDLAVALRVWG